MTPERWARIKDIFSEALASPAENRGALLDARCGGDAALRAEVASLLASHDAAGDFIEQPAVAHAGADRSRDGEMLGPYRLERQIGRGGMGAVYLAWRADDEFRQRVAIKVIKRGMDTDEIVARFRRERQTLANLDHPNIARLLDGGTTDDGLPYFVMEYVDGEPLDRYCRTHNLALRDRIRLFRTICAAVQFAHRNLVVHRDLKPDNILVTSGGVPKLLDFGIAKLLRDSDESGTIVPTRPADRMMTLDYASPEQLRGDTISTASDVFSLGVMLYELVSGAHPFRRDGRTSRDVETAICEEEPPRADPGELGLIVRMAMRKEPSRRYGAANELDDDLRRHLEGLPVAAHADSIGYRASKFARRHRAGVAAAALIGVSLVGGLIGVSMQARIATAERDRASLEADKARRVSDMLEQMLRAADPDEDGRNVTVASVLDEASRRAGVELASQPELLAAMRSAIGNTYYSLGLLKEAKEQNDLALPLFVSVYGPASLETATARANLANIYLDHSDYDSATRELAAALAALDEARARDAARDDRAVRARVMTGLGLVAARTGKDEESEARYREALALSTALYGNTDLRVAEIVNNLAVNAQGRADLAEAERLYRDSLRIVQALQGDRHPDVATAISNLAGVLHSEKKLDEARPLYERALSMRRELLGEDHPSIAFTEFNYAELLNDQRDHRAAIDMNARVLARRGKALPEGHPIVPAALVSRGRARMALGDGKAAERDIREGLALRRASLPPDHWLIASTESTLGECLMIQGRAAEAEPLLVSSYQRLDKSRGPSHERTLDARRRLARLYDATGRPALAAPLR